MLVWAIVLKKRTKFSRISECLNDDGALVPLGRAENDNNKIGKNGNSGGQGPFLE